MKISSFKSGQVGLLLACSVLVTACNPQEEFFLNEELITGEDAFCYAAKTLESCQQLVDRCQPAMMPSSEENAEPVFALCIANPDAYDPVGNPSDPSDPSDPTIQEAYDSKCMNLDPKFIWEKKEVSKKSTKVTSKVKVCHQTGNNSSHAIVIACPALKAHIKHHDDYLGACKK